MFPLYTKTFPSNAAALAELLNASLQRLFSGAPDAVSIRERNFPALAEVCINLDRAELRSNPPPPPSVSGNAAAGLTVDELQISASDLSVGPARVDLRLRARDVALNRATDRNGDIVLVLQRASDGEVEIAADKSELERAIAALARQQASQHGVNIDQVQLTARPRGPRGLDAEVQLRGRKLFFSTVVRITAKLDLDDELTARLSGLTCNGDGAVGALACSVLEPHLRALNGRTFPLLALPLGDVRLRDVRLAAGDKLSVTAEFGC
jgi:hypothetical protein